MLVASVSSISMSCCLSRNLRLWENSSLSLKMFELNHKVREWCLESSSFLTWVTQTRLLSWLYSRQTRVWVLVIRPGSRDQNLIRTLAFFGYTWTFSSLANSTSPTRVAVWSKSDWQSRVDLTQYIVSAVSLWRRASIDLCIKLIYSLIFTEYIIVIIITGHN